jgi:hypothetical protein
MELNMQRMDEGEYAISIAKLREMLTDIDRGPEALRVSPAELDYYCEHIQVNEMQQRMMIIFYSPRLGNYSPILSARRREYVKLVVHMRKWMELSGLSFLPAFVTARFPEGGGEPKKIIATKEFVTSLTRNASWRRLHNTKYRVVQSNLLRQNLIAKYVTIFQTVKAEYVPSPEEYSKGLELEGYLADHFGMTQILDEILKFVESV